MNFKGKTFWEMEKESISYAHRYENLWIKYAVITVALEALERNEQELDHAFKSQEANDPGGEVARKNQLFENFFHKVYRLGRKLSFYAKVTQDKVLLNDVALSESVFRKLSEKESLIKCSNVIRRGNEYLDKTKDYGVTAEELTSLNDELAVLEKMHPTIGMITNDHKSATRTVTMLIREAGNLLDNLDDGFEGLVEDKPYLEGWFAVRKIKGRHNYVKARVPAPVQTVLN